MPSGAKKRKALKKKKKEQESTGISKGNDNGDNLHANIKGNDDPGSQDEKESDGNLSSPSSQGNEEEEAGKRLPSVFEKDTVKEKKAEASVLADSFEPHVSASEVVTFDKKEQVKTSNSDSVKHEFGGLEEKEMNKDGKLITTSEPDEVSKDVKSGPQSEIPKFPEEKRLLAPGPPVARTSWLSCCGLFDAVAGSER